MIPIYQVHPCWLHFINEHREKFVSYDANFSYFMAKSFMDMFSIDVKDIKVVVLNDAPNNISTENLRCSNINNYSSENRWLDKGVMVLNLSITPGFESFAEQIYWYNFIRDIIDFISRYNPTIWVYFENENIKDIHSYIIQINNRVETNKYIKTMSLQGFDSSFINKNIPIIPLENHVIMLKSFQLNELNRMWSYVNQLLNIQQKPLIEW